MDLSIKKKGCSVKIIRKNINIFVYILISLFFWGLATTGSAAPSIAFIDPTPDNGSKTVHNFAVIKASIIAPTDATAFIDWDHSLVAWWRFNNEPGETSTLFNDWSRNGNNGMCKVENCPSLTPGRFGNALQMDGNEYVDAGNGGSVTGNLTIIAWIKRGNDGGWRTIVSKGESQQEFDHNYVLYLSPTNALIFGFGENDGKTFRNFGTNSTIDTNWHHIAAVVNSATDIKIYVDGVSQPGTYEGNISTILTANSKKLLIGSSSTTTEFFNGAIDEVTVWNRALSQDEIRASYNAGSYGLSGYFTGLSTGTYDYRAYVQNPTGTVAETETRTLNVISAQSGFRVLQNNATYLNTPTYDGSGQATHPDIYYNASGWNGYKYWMVFTPYQGGDAQYENPSILTSNNGISWIVPAGLSNPIDPEPASGSNSDPDIVFNENKNELEVYYVEAGAGTSYFNSRYSTDGIHWSNEQNIFNLPDYQIMSPAIIRKDGIYNMWYTGSPSCSAPTVVQFRTSTDGLAWGAPQNVNIDQPGQNIWHLDVQYIPSLNQYWMLFAAYPSNSDCGNTDLYFAESTDKINWITYPDKMLAKSVSWDSAEIYRSSFLYDSANDLLRVWYSARNSTNYWHIGYTEG